MKAYSENTAFIALGSNLGNRLRFLQKSLNAVALITSTKILSVSSVYLTRPFGIKEQNDFFNAAAKLATKLTPIELFNSLKKIEKSLGRSTAQKWGPREIDIDLLFYNDLIFSDDFISLPHKGIIYRDFVLEPLLELDKELVHPETKISLSISLSELEEKFVIKKLPDKLFIPEKKH